jgi:hypothetical protein
MLPRLVLGALFYVRPPRCDGVTSGGRGPSDGARGLARVSQCLATSRPIQPFALFEPVFPGRDGWPPP